MSGAKVSWRLENHIIGKVYDLTQANMNAMIADVERLKAENAVMREALTVLNHSGRTDYQTQEARDVRALVSNIAAEALAQLTPDPKPEQRKARGAMEFALMTLEHAQELGYLGEGSTKGMADDAIKKLREVLDE